MTGVPKCKQVYQGEFVTRVLTVVTKAPPARGQRKQRCSDRLREREGVTGIFPLPSLDWVIFVKVRLGTAREASSARSARPLCAARPAESCAFFAAERARAL
eukprot:1188174-Prorocentrum_minimum.AAC.1